MSTSKRSLLSKALGLVNLEYRSSMENPQTPLSMPAEWLLDIYNGGRTDSGIRVSEMTALQVGTVLSCVNIIANGIATSPCQVIEATLTDEVMSSKVAYTHNLYDLLAEEPNPEMTASTWLRTMMCHKLLWGNAYTEIQRDWKNQIVALWPRNPSNTRPVRLLAPLQVEGDLLPKGTLLYETYETIGDSQVTDDSPSGNQNGMRRLILAEDMIHVPGLSLDGRLGMDIVQMARQAIGLALATEKYGAKFFGNGAIPAGLLSVPGDMTEVQWETFQRSWAQQHGGENSHRTGTLPPGVTYTKTGATPNEGQMLETRGYQRTDIAAIFNVPGHMVGDAKEQGGKSTVEQGAIELVLYCLKPHFLSLEQEFKRKLFHKVGQAANKYRAKFDVRQLMYPDAASRTTFYSGGKNWGYLNTNRICAMEGMNPVTDGSGDTYYMPINMQDAAMVAKQSQSVQKDLKAGNLSAVPTGFTPVGDHPAVKDAQKAADTALKTTLAAKPAQADSGKADAKKPSKKAAKAKAKRCFLPVFRDAVGRAAFRKKPNEADYTTIFGPVLDAIHDFLEIGTDEAEFLRTYTTDLFKRSQTEGWDKAELDVLAEAECEAAVDALLPKSDTWED